MKPSQPDRDRDADQVEVFNAMRRAGAASRMEIMHATGLCETVVADIVAGLLRRDLIFQKEDDRDRLVLKADAAHVAGVQVTESAIACAVVDFAGDIGGSAVLSPQGKGGTVASLVDGIEAAFQKCLGRAKLDMGRIAAIAVGLPGLIDSQQRICHWTPLLERKWEDLSIRIQERFSIPVLIENSTLAEIMAYKWYGSGRDCDNYILVDLADSVGMGMVVNGRVYRVNKNVYGQFGHTVIVPGGVVCRCGKRGCLDAYASTGAIITAARRACSAGEWTCADIDRLELEELIEKAGEGEEVPEEIFRLAGAVLGLGISGLIQAFCPARIVLTGRGVRAGRLLLDPMREALEIHTHGTLLAMSDIVVHEGVAVDSAGGAAMLALVSTCLPQNEPHLST